jgi:hypothetical protein
MKIVSFIDEEAVIRGKSSSIVDCQPAEAPAFAGAATPRQIGTGGWKEPAIRPSPTAAGNVLDCGFAGTFVSQCMEIALRVSHYVVCIVTRPAPDHIPQDPLKFSTFAPEPVRKLCQSC